MPRLRTAGGSAWGASRAGAFIPELRRLLKMPARKARAAALINLGSARGGERGAAIACLRAAGASGPKPRQQRPRDRAGAWDAGAAPCKAGSSAATAAGSLTPGLAGQEEAEGKHQARGAPSTGPGPSHHPPNKKPPNNHPGGDTFLFFR